MKTWKHIVISIVIIALVWIVNIEIILPRLIENLFRDIEQSIEEEFDRQVNELMRNALRDEIIRQLKEKEGKTIQDYYIEDFFRRMK